MFNKKFLVSVLNSDWVVIKANLRLKHLPRIEEYLFFNEKYYRVINLIHLLDKSQHIFIIIDEKAELLRDKTQ